MDHYSFVLHFLLFIAGEHLSFASCLSERASCPTQAQQLWHTGLVAPRMWSIPGPGIKSMSPALSDEFSTTGQPVCLALFPFEMHIYFVLEYNCFTMLC